MNDETIVPQLIKDIGGTPSRHTGQHTLQLIARSPNTKAAREVISALPYLSEKGVRFEAVFKSIPKRGPGSAVLKRVAEAYGADVAKQSVRVADFPDSGEVFEQVNFGSVAVWTGFELSRSRSAPLTEEGLQYVSDDPRAASLASISFASVWAASSLVPYALFRSLPSSQPEVVGSISYV